MEGNVWAPFNPTNNYFRAWGRIFGTSFATYLALVTAVEFSRYVNDCYTFELTHPYPGEGH